MKIEKSTVKLGFDLDNIMSESHRYKSKKGEISLLHPSRATFNSYEIYCVSENLFDDIERYNSLKAAEKRIDELLL